VSLRDSESQYICRPPREQAHHAVSGAIYRSRSRSELLELHSRATVSHIRIASNKVEVLQIAATRMKSVRLLPALPSAAASVDALKEPSTQCCATKGERENGEAILSVHRMRFHIASRARRLALPQTSRRLGTATIRVESVSRSLARAAFSRRSVFFFLKVRRRNSE
jgi:hypothetical protein